VPAYVPGFEHDVFVSYARVDNELGWVNKLVKELEVRLAERLGRPRPSVWMDHQIRGNESLDQIYRAVRSTAALLIVKSAGYLKSDWCRNELLAFFAQQNNERNRVFAVNTDHYEPERLPEALRALTGYDFWTVDDETRIRMRLGMPETSDQDAKYYKQLARLAAQLADRLQACAPMAFSDANATPPVRVFLAELPEDSLEPQRLQVEEALTQAGIQVVPEEAHLAADLAKFEDWSRSMLPSCRAFVQLLSASSGKTRAFAKGLPALQLELATAAKIPTMQWRDVALALASVASDDHRALLQHETVRTYGLHELVSDILKVTGTQPKAFPEPVSVLINGDLCDRDLGERVREHLIRRSVTAELPPVGGKPRVVREFLMEQLLSCDAAFIVHRQSQWTWVNEQINQVAEKNLFRRKLAPPRSPAAVGLLLARKINGGELDAHIEDLHRFQVGDDMDEFELNGVIDEFLAKLRNRSHGPRTV